MAAHDIIPGTAPTLLGGGWRTQFRWHRDFIGPLRTACWQVVWNPEGGGSLIVDKRPWSLTADNCWLVAPGQWLQRASPRPMAGHLWAHLHWPIAGPPGAIGVPLNHALRAIAEQAIDRLVAGDRRASATLSAWAAQVVAHLPPSPSSPAIPAWLSELETWMQQQGWQSVDNRELAHRLGIHEKSLCRRFAREIGMTPRAWLRHRSLALAATELLRGSRISQIANDAGYSDVQHFQRAFRRHYGLSPGRWRTAAVADHK